MIPPRLRNDSSGRGMILPGCGMIISLVGMILSGCGMILSGAGMIFSAAGIIFFAQKEAFSPGKTYIRRVELTKTPTSPRKTASGDGGKTAHYMLCWRYKDGSTTAWSETVSATIGA